MKIPLSVMDDPRAWFEMVRQQLVEHREYVQEMEKAVPKVEDRDPAAFRDLYYTGWLMGQDVLAAAGALIKHLESVNLATAAAKSDAPTRGQSLDNTALGMLPWHRAVSFSVSFDGRDEDE